MLARKISQEKQKKAFIVFCKPIRLATGFVMKFVMKSQRGVS